MPLRLLFFIAALALADEPSRQAAVPLPLRAQLPVDLRVEPGLLTPYDRSLLESSSYQFPQDGSIRAPDGKALARPELIAVLERLRDARRREGLAVFEEAQRALLQGEGRLPPEQQGRLQFVLARDWDVIPADIRGGINELLKSGGARAVEQMDLAWVARVRKAWEKGEPFEAQVGAGPGSAALGQPYMPRPPPAEVVLRLQELQGASYADQAGGQKVPYAPEVNESLRLIAQHASAEDWEAVRRFLKTGTPIWYSNAEAFPYSLGAAWTPTGFPDHERNGKPATRIAMPEYRVGDGYRALPHPDAAYYERNGLPVPRLDAMDRGRKGRMGADGIERFPDGSTRIHPSARERAGTLFHEILHIDTHHGLHAGCNSWANERRSFAGGNRLEHNWDEAAGGATGQGEAGIWLNRPVDYWSKKLNVYMSPQVGEVRPDEVTVRDHLKRIERALAARGPELERLRREELDRHLKRYEDMDAAIIDQLTSMDQMTSPQAEAARARSAERFRQLRLSPEFRDWDYRAHLLREREALLKDQELSVRAFLDDWKWHESRGYPYAGQSPSSAPLLRRVSSEPPAPPR